MFCFQYDINQFPESFDYFPNGSMMIQIWAFRKFFSFPVK